MRYYFITFRSVTYAQQGERLLKGSGFRCALHRTPRWMEEQGCGYALKVRSAEIEPATALLAERQIPCGRQGRLLMRYGHRAVFLHPSGPSNGTAR